MIRTTQSLLHMHTQRSADDSDEDNQILLFGLAIYNRRFYAMHCSVCMFDSVHTMKAVLCEVVYVILDSVHKALRPVNGSQFTLCVSISAGFNHCCIVSHVMLGKSFRWGDAWCATLDPVYFSVSIDSARWWYFVTLLLNLDLNWSRKSLVRLGYCPNAHQQRVMRTRCGTVLFQN